MPEHQLLHVTHPPRLWQPPFYSFASTCLTSLDASHEWGHTVFVLLWLTYSVSRMSSKFTHAVANGRISFLQAKWHLIVMNHMFLIHSSVSGHVGCLYILRVYSVAHWCPTLSDHMNCSLPGSSLHGIFQARLLEWVSTSYFRGSSQPGDWTCVSCIGRQALYRWATWKAFSHTSYE